MTTATTPARLVGEDLTVGYDGRTVLRGLDVAVPTGELTVVVGPNGCGKSTLLRALARMLPTTTGRVLLDGVSIGEFGGKEVARILGLLPQSPVAPEGILVDDLVARGRYPYQTMLRQWSVADADAVESALERAGVADLRDRMITELSGGQRQRVWIAMVLAQQTSLLLLDEPTTFLDISHQLDVLDLCRSLRDDGKTVVAVLHDLNLAFRYATHLIVMAEGAIVAQGPPAEVVTTALMADVFGLSCRIMADPESGTPLVIPTVRGRAS